MRIITAAFAILLATNTLADVPLNLTAVNELPPAIIGNAASLQGQDIAYFDGNEKTLGYLAVPEGDGPHSAIILIHQWNGLVPRVKETADSFAAEGYVALAVDLYGGKLGANPEENMALIGETQENPDEVIANLNAAVKLLKSRGDSNGKVGTIGWCFGGGVALTFALGGDDHEATAIFYGSLLDDPEQMSHINHEIYGTFASNDTGIPVDLVNSFVAAMRSVGIANDVHIYDHISHGFWLNIDRNPELNTPAGLDAWQRLKAYFERTLGD